MSQTQMAVPLVLTDEDRAELARWLAPISAQLIRPLLVADHWAAVGGLAQVSQSGRYGAACSRCRDLPATASLIAFLNSGPQSDVMPGNSPDGTFHA